MVVAPPTAPQAAPPVMTQPPAPSVPVETPEKSAIIINIPNASGGFTAVKLIRHKNGYIGPQGEFYAGHPTVEELKVLYGK